MINNFFFQKSCHLWDSVEKNGVVREDTDDNITRRMRFAYWINKVTRARTHTHTYGPEAFQHCYEQWKQHLRRYVAAQGNYFQGDNLDL